MDAPTLTVAENICLGRLAAPRRGSSTGARCATRARARRSTALGVGHRRRAAGELAAHRRAPDRRDRPGHRGPGPLPDPRRADRRALGRRGRAALRLRAAAARARRGDRLHHPPARRGPRDRRPRAGPARRVHRARPAGWPTSSRADLVTAMVGAGRGVRTARAAYAPTGRPPALELARASSDRAFADVELRRRARRGRSALYGKIGSGIGEVAEDAVRDPRAHGAAPWTSRARRVDAARAARRRSATASGSSPATASARARS